MDYFARTHLHLPYVNGGEGERIKPGSMVTEAQLRDAQQTDEDIDALVESGAICPWSDEAVVDPAHFQVTADRYGEAVVLHPVTGERVDPVSAADASEEGDNA